jgi:hypothetical protein
MSSFNINVNVEPVQQQPKKEINMTIPKHYCEVCDTVISLTSAYNHYKSDIHKKNYHRFIKGELSSRQDS